RLLGMRRKVHDHQPPVAESPVSDGECAAIIGAARHHRLFHALDACHINRLAVVPDFTTDTTHGRVS
ncbi:MAG TPA: hypothetical protein DDW89_08330, partial [Gammaproteobacteria bacterium]|nr:hypothetical protein [Gammaproteobacteria bacterium]